jgi:hypothetical protein
MTGSISSALVYRVGLICFFGCISLLSPLWAATTLYVSPQGNDQWSGRSAAPNAARSDGPFATVARAQKALRQLRAAGQLSAPVAVVLRGGLHCLPETLELGPEDSGSAEAPVNFRSHPGEQAWLSGGRVLQGWREITRPGPRRWVADLPEVKAGEWFFSQLFVQRQGEPFFTRRFRPTTPMRVVADLTWSPQRKTQAHRAAQPDFVFFPDDLQRWHNLAEVEVVALHSWSASRLKIADLDLEKKVVTFTSVPTFRIGHWYKDERNPYYAENIREELKSPGQWYLDTTAGTLTYLPLAGETLQNTTVVAPRLERLVVVKGDVEPWRPVRGIVFENIVFAHSDWPLPTAGYDTSQGQPALSSAVEVTGAEGIRFERCRFAHTGAYGLGFGQGANQCAIIGGLLYDLGGGGVKVGEQTLKADSVTPVLPTGNTVENCTIMHYGVQHYSANGIWCGIVKGTRLRHNHVTHGPYTGIAVGWAWHDKPTSCGDNLIERNHVHQVMDLVQDGGGIYTLGRQPGTVIRGNLIHDNQPSPFACAPGQCGLYLDEGSSDFLIEDNVIYNVAWDNDRITQNRNTADQHTIRTNYHGLRPGEAGFPTALAAQAGVQSQYRWPQEATLRFTPNPVYAMTLPQVPPRPVGFNHDFEDVPLGRMPRRINVAGASGQADIGVSDELAASGQRSLRFRDTAGLTRPFYPYLQYNFETVEQAQVELAFKVRQHDQKPGRFWVELRDYKTAEKGNYFAGPSLGFMGSGEIKHGQNTVMTLPPGQWVEVSLHFVVGPGAPAQFELQVIVPGQQKQQFTLPFSKPQFRALTSLIISADGESEAIFYLDDMKFEVIPQ